MVVTMFGGCATYRGSRTTSIVGGAITVSGLAIFAGGFALGGSNTFGGSSSDPNWSSCGYADSAGWNDCQAVGLAGAIVGLIGLVPTIAGLTGMVRYRHD